MYKSSLQFQKIKNPITQFQFFFRTALVAAPITAAGRSLLRYTTVGPSPRPPLVHLLPAACPSSQSPPPPHSHSLVLSWIRHLPVCPGEEALED